MSRSDRWMHYVDGVIEGMQVNPKAKRKTKLLDYFVMVPLIIAMVVVSVLFDAYVEVTADKDG